MQTKIEEVINQGKKTIEIIKADEEKKFETLKKKTTNLENKMKKKDEEIAELKNLMKLKQSNFMESLQTLTNEFAIKQKDLESVLLQKQEEINKLEEKLHQSTDSNGSPGVNEDLIKNSEKNSKENEPKQLQENPDVNQSDPHKSVNSEKECYACGKIGHVRRQCPNPLIDTNKKQHANIHAHSVV